MLLKVLIVRSTTQKDESLSASVGTSMYVMRGPEMYYYRLVERTS
jgi:hypothetical protein